MLVWQRVRWAKATCEPLHFGWMNASRVHEKDVLRVHVQATASQSQGLHTTTCQGHKGHTVPSVAPAWGLPDLKALNSHRKLSTPAEPSWCHRVSAAALDILIRASCLSGNRQSSCSSSGHLCTQDCFEPPAGSMLHSRCNDALCNMLSNKPHMHLPARNLMHPRHPGWPLRS